MRTIDSLALSALLCVLLAGCGGGGGDTSGADNPPPTAPGPTDAARATAATSTASNNTACTRIAPFHWEIGDKTQKLVSGSVGTGYTADTGMAIASATKFLYAAYVLQQRAGNPTADDVQYLTFRSGYTSFTYCARDDSVHSCATSGSNDTLMSANVGKFSYGGGHMQQHADRYMGLGPDANAALTQALNTTLMLNAPPSQFLFTLPQPAGGVATTPAIYARFLRELLDGSLVLGSHLSDDAVCANARLCPGQVVNSPAPPGENTQYALGHRIEDPTISDGAFSSAGKFGFYPWIDSTRQYYGIVARSVTTGPSVDNPAEPEGTLSMYCGRVIRKAWMTGTPQ